MLRRMVAAIPLVALLGAACSPSPSPSSPVNPSPPPESVVIREAGSFHIGGGQYTLRDLPSRDQIVRPGTSPAAVDPNGDFEVGQMYVQFMRLASPRAKYPLLFWHGGGLTGVTFETTPDGRPGWQWYFLKAGHDVYVSDSVERGRASWARYPEIYPAEPTFRTKQGLWSLFRIGPADSYATEVSNRRAYEDTKFPVGSYDQFFKQVVPRFTTNDNLTQASYDTLVARICPCVLLTHSAAGPFGFNTTLRQPDKIMAHIAIEPSGAPNPETNPVAAIADIPHLFVWADHLGLDDPQGIWTGLYDSTKKFSEALKKTEWVDLPAKGITGNSHMLMMDSNSDEIAGIIQDWMARQGLMR